MLIETFPDSHGYLAAATMGLPPRETMDALTADLAAWQSGTRNPKDYDGVVQRTRSSYAALVGVSPQRVAIGSQTSVMASLVASAVPAGAEVLCVDGDFSSIVFPFVASAATVRSVPLERLAAEITDATWLVVFSLVQSATGRVADVDAIVAAAASHDAFTLCDTSQATGVLPVDASRFDATVCHAYKWLCAPRGVAFLTVGERLDPVLVPLHAGWYAGDDPWQSCYGPDMHLATSARRFDVSPVWSAWIGAEQSLALFASLDINEVWKHAVGLADMLCERLDIAPQHQAIVTWPDQSGEDLSKLTQSGLTASGRAGRLRAAFHVWNTEADVAAVVSALGR